MNDLSSLVRAAAYAAKMHTGQTRKGADEQPYINHPLEVANLVANVGGVTDHDVLIAAILHDVIEDCGVTKDELTDLFGGRAAGIVEELTDDKSLPKKERKRLQIEHAPQLSHEAKTVKLADKISNITDVMNNPPAKWDKKRRRKYIEWGEAVVDRLRGANPALESHFDELVIKAKAGVAASNGNTAAANPKTI